MKDQPIVMEGAYAKQYTDWMVATGGYAKDMTLRDHFAGLAMQAQLSMPEINLAISRGDITIKNVSGGCYEWADLMLKERNK